ncbi:hypothetical protein M885DRAFT_91114 [Pelagophyceae sp. CCMP2097]|nr:hypothetical protein M885DRAFT_91114 [Pelagophyceae sp. CCMP2097]
MRDSMFDDSGAGQKRLEREAEARRNAARRHRDEDAAAQRRVNEAMAETKRIAEEFRAKRELEDERARLVALRRARLTGGIDWQSRGLRVVPAARDGDRVELAASALGELTSLGALDSSPLMFEVELDVADDAVPMDVDGGGGGDDDGGDAADERLAVNRRATHAGVESFTAVEGTIGLPPKTLLSLVRGDGGVAARLERGELRLRVRYVQLRRASECRASLRPRRDGFFAGGAESADVDLKAVLEAELGRGRHTTLSRGDWLSVRHDGRTVHLVVEQLDPDDALCIVSTDLEVDVLPSESVDDAAKRVAAAAVAAAAQLEHRAAHAAQCRAELAAPPPAAAGAAVRVLLRFSDGARVTEALDAAAPLRRLVAHVDLKCCESDAVCAPESDALDWTVRTTFPARCFSRAQLAANGATLRSRRRRGRRRRRRGAAARRRRARRGDGVRRGRGAADGPERTAH